MPYFIADYYFEDDSLDALYATGNEDFMWSGDLKEALIFNERSDAELFLLNNDFETHPQMIFAPEKPLFLDEDS
jgi:hypothetical protein